MRKLFISTALLVISGGLPAYAQLQINPNLNLLYIPPTQETVEPITFDPVVITNIDTTTSGDPTISGATRPTGTTTTQETTASTTPETPNTGDNPTTIINSTIPIDSTTQQNGDTPTRTEILTINPKTPTIGQPERNPETGELVCPTQEALECPTPQVIKAQLDLGKIQWGWLVFGGAGIGALMWVFAYYAMNSSQMRRESLRLNRLLHIKGQEEKFQQLEKAYPKISGIIASFLTQPQGKNISGKDLEQYRKNAIAMELFGSEKTQEAHKNFLQAVQKGSQKDIEAKGKTLLNSLKGDLGLKNQK